MGQPYAFGYGATADYASWGPRVAAWLIDALIAFVPLAIGYVVFFASIGSDDSPSAAGGLLLFLGWVGWLAVIMWNLGYKQGTTGQSIGKGVLGIKVVDLSARTPIGFGKGVLRALLNYIFNSACFLNVLWPLWDQQNQTWTDKVIATYVVLA
jgi:uncharacterized RDD family membrane protein YckC